MRYLDALNERNKENQKLKNKAMNRPTDPTGKPGKHSTDGSERGRRERPATRARNVRIRPGETRDVITKGRTGRVTAAGRLIGPNRPFADLALKTHTPDTKPNIPGPKPGEKPKLDVSHIEYKRMGLLMAESLGYEIDEVLNFVVQGARALGTGIAKGVGAAARGVGNFVTGAAKKKAMEKAMEKGEDAVRKVTGRRDDGKGVGRKRVGDMDQSQMDQSQMGQSQMEAYKQVGRMISEVLSPEKHAKETGGGKEAANRRYRRIRAVLRGKRISPIAGVEAVDKRGVTFSRAAEKYRAARDSGASERPRDLKPSYSK